MQSPCTAGGVVLVNTEFRVTIPNIETIYLELSAQMNTDRPQCALVGVLLLVGNVGCRVNAMAEAISPDTSVMLPGTIMELLVRANSP